MSVKIFGVLDSSQLRATPGVDLDHRLKLDVFRGGNKQFPSVSKLAFPGGSAPVSQSGSSANQKVYIAQVNLLPKPKPTEMERAVNDLVNKQFRGVTEALSRVPKDDAVMRAKVIRQQLQLNRLNDQLRADPNPIDWDAIYKMSTDKK